MAKKSPRQAPKGTPKGPEGKPDKQMAEFENSLTGLAAGVGGTGQNPFTQQLSKTATLIANIRGYLISNNRTLLSQLYVEHGIIQALVDLPVDDAFRLGFDIKSGELDADDIEQLKIYWEKSGLGRAVISALKWSRLFGGGAVILITEDDPATPLDWSTLKPDSRIEYRGVDLWELYNIGWNGFNDTEDTIADENPDQYKYYGITIHPSRVFPIKGKEAPSFVRRQLRGWGTSVVERLVRSMNQYLKNQDVLFELLDEAKVDVYQIEDLNAALMNNEGTQAVTKRIQAANMIKSYLSALVMDKNDSYEQKQIAFTGLAEVMTVNRQEICCDVRFPMTKLFGISAAGFSSGEEDNENYNGMVESEVRAPSKYVVVDLLRLGCQINFGIAPEDLLISWPSLRILDAKDEEEVKNSQFNRVMAAYQAGLASDIEAKESINKASLLPHELDQNAPALPPPGADEEEEDFRTQNDKESK